MENAPKQLHFSFTIKGTGTRKAEPSSRPVMHGSTKWWRGRIIIEGVILHVHASPNGIHLPTGVSLEDELHDRVESHLTREAAKLNRRERRGQSG